MQLELDARVTGTYIAEQFIQKAVARRDGAVNADFAAELRRGGGQGAFLSFPLLQGLFGIALERGALRGERHVAVVPFKQARA